MDVRRRRLDLLLTLLRDSTRLFMRAIEALVLLAAVLGAAALTLVWVGIPLLLRVADLVRARAETERARVREHLRVDLRGPPRDAPTGPVLARVAMRVAEPVTRGELLWLTYQATAGVLVTALSVLECLTHLVLWWLPGPYVLTMHSRCSVRLLRTPGTGLEERVSELTRWRTLTVESQAAELRRIERDLHDGAQARLIALSLHLGMAHTLFDTDPDEARRMVLEARGMSGDILTGLRDLVRGIYPPVLSERGLGDAVRALALSMPVPIEVDVSLPPQRLGAALESAVFFAISESLTNAVKHADATLVRVSLRLDAHVLRIRVIDDGIGGADPRAGTGLAGLKHRLQAFDGAVSIQSPAGGPTEILMEAPCESS
ncbi:sensor histidine kinase [Cellulomonas chengniuliangii]|uniref:sensor histidine kinase n=1 Tax=Cellulomonas chengniuliangii TaxID=2968084 RepID=UPI001D0F2F5E|nr:sensor domain-containing protein [Cellulomonas chengniuliangii]MCC2318336.1 sensor domain-containing protein [Cellulomonas chengniuliangii]